MMRRDSPRIILCTGSRTRGKQLMYKHNDKRHEERSFSSDLFNFTYDFELSQADILPAQSLYMIRSCSNDK
jgi:hypothetical protein